MNQIKIDALLEDIHGFTQDEEVAVIIKGTQYILVCDVQEVDGHRIYRLFEPTAG